MMNKMIAIPAKDAIEYGENTNAMFSLLSELRELLMTETRLKKHHRPYLHLREQIDEKVKEIAPVLTKVAVDMLALPCSAVSVEDDVDCAGCICEDCEEDCRMCKDSPCYDGDSEDLEDEEDTVTLPKEQYDLMVEDLLTMAELIDMVSDMRTRDVTGIRELAKYIPGFASFEKERLSLYRAAAKEAEEIMDRWEDVLDEDDEPDEYFSD